MINLTVQSLGQELQALWSPAELKRWPARALRDVDIPDASKQFLTQVGLPDIWPRTVRFPREAEPLRRLDAAHPHYRVIGVVPEEWTLQRIPCVCLDEQQGGRVLYIRRMTVRHEPHRSYFVYDEQPGGPEELINTRIECLAAFLILHRTLCDKAEALRERLPDRPSAQELKAYEAAVLPLLEQTEQEMRCLDSQALQDVDEGWWPGMLSELRDYGMWG